MSHFTANSLQTSSQVSLQFHFTTHFVVRCSFLCGLTARCDRVAMVSKQALQTTLLWMLDVLIKQKPRHTPGAATRMDSATTRVLVLRAALQQDSRLKCNREQPLSNRALSVTFYTSVQNISCFTILREEFCSYSYLSGEDRDVNLYFLLLKAKDFFC